MIENTLYIKEPNIFSTNLGLDSSEILPCVAAIGFGGEEERVGGLRGDWFQLDEAQGRSASGSHVHFPSIFDFYLTTLLSFRVQTKQKQVR